MRFHLDAVVDDTRSTRGELAAPVQRFQAALLFAVATWKFRAFWDGMIRNVIVELKPAQVYSYGDGACGKRLAASLPSGRC
jgi:hypothetical protein